MENKRILLIDPPMQRFMDFSKAGLPLGILYIAGELKKQGHTVKVYDADYNPQGTALPFIEKIHHYTDYINSLNGSPHKIWDEAQNVLNDFQPDIVGISVISTKLASGLKLAKMAKEKGARVIMGGPHATICPEEVIESPYVDAVVVGEGEKAFNTALNADGITMAERIKDLDSLAGPAIDTLHNLSGYKTKDLGMIMTSRGCPNACNFCCSSILWKGGVTYRSLENITAEVENLQKNHKVNNFYPVDDTFTDNEERVLEFSKLMAEKNLSWSCLTRADRMNEKVVYAMVNSGCSLIKIGLESGSERVLNEMNKRTKKDDIKRAAELFKKHGLSWMAYVMVGVPGEKKEDVEETKSFIREIEPTYVSLSNFTPYPGTVFFKRLGLGRLPYHLFNHHSQNSVVHDISEEERMDFFKWADDWNSKVK